MWERGSSCHHGKSTIQEKGLPSAGWQTLDHLTELSRYVYETANLQLRNGQPFVGKSAFAHKGGMHVHAINKYTHTYEHMDPALVGNERRILVSELSGRSNIAALTQDTGLAADRETLDRILSEVVIKENQAISSKPPKARLICWCGVFQDPIRNTLKRSNTKCSPGI